MADRGYVYIQGLDLCTSEMINSLTLPENSEPETTPLWREGAQTGSLPEMTNSLVSRRTEWAPRMGSRLDTRTLSGTAIPGQVRAETDDPQIGPLGQAQVKNDPKTTTRPVPWSPDREVAEMTTIP